MRRATTVLLGLVTFGCLYDEPFLPGRPEVLDQQLLGEWRCISSERASAEPAILTVSRDADRTYRAEFVGGGGDPTVFSAYTVAVANARFLNAQEIVDNRPRKWTVARYTLHTPTILHIEFARDEPFRGIANKDQLAAFKRELKGNRLFEEYCLCVRIKDSRGAAAPHNIEMRRTKPAQAVELRR